MIYFNNVSEKAEKTTRSVILKGVITKIAYNEKGFPNVEINNDNMYSLSFGNLNELGIGDSLSKGRNCDTTFQYRNKTLINVFTGSVIPY